MGWRFRRTLSVKPFRFVVTRRGIGVGTGWNWGIPGLRFGVNPSGDRYVSIGIRGIGLYWIKCFRRNPSSGVSSPPQPPIAPPAAQARLGSPAAPQRPWWKP